jgi:hypothetical protein
MLGLVLLAAMHPGAILIAKGSSGSASPTLQPGEPHLRRVTVEVDSRIYGSFEAYQQAIEFFFIYEDDYENHNLTNPSTYHQHINAQSASFDFSPSMAGTWYLVFVSEVEQTVVYSFVEETDARVVLNWLFYSAVLAGGIVLVFGVAFTVRKRRQE